jgi:hypothetical protein
MAESKNISGVEAIRQLIKAQKEWFPIKANAFTAGNDGTNDYITIGDEKLTEE